MKPGIDAAAPGVAVDAKDNEVNAEVTVGDVKPNVEAEVKTDVEAEVNTDVKAKASLSGGVLTGNDFSMFSNSSAKEHCNETKTSDSSTSIRIKTGKYSDSTFKKIGNKTEKKPITINICTFQ